MGTGHHPRDYNTSIYHGYIQNGQNFNSAGTLLDSIITDKTAPKLADFTRVFAANTIIRGIKMTRCWTVELQTYPDHTIATIFKARVTDSEMDHRFFYARYDGATWTTTYLGMAGSKMYSSEEDYVGLGALHPNDPNTLYLATPFDPRDDANLGVREIFKGVTPDHGATWYWTPITQKSVRDNFRPIVPAWDQDHTALLWLRGTYSTAQRFDAAVVGILERSAEKVGLMHYVDATLNNTSLATGAPLVTTGPDANKGPTDNKWHLRTDFGNGSSVLTSAEVGGENEPTLKTRVTVPNAGIYDVWVNFWANPTADWRIKAGLTENQMQIFRQIACKSVEVNTHDASLVLTGSGNVFLYQAYLGRVQIAANDSFEVLVDDEAIRTGTQSTLTGDVARTWYDGISYANVNAATRIAEKNGFPMQFSLSQNFPNPFNPATTITYSLTKNAHVDLKIFNLSGQEIVTLVNGEMSVGMHRISWNAQNVPSGVYYYKITVGTFSIVKKMMLLK